MLSLVRTKAVPLLVGALCLTSSTLHAQEAEDADISIVKGDAVLLSDIDDWLVGVFGPNDSINQRVGNFDFFCAHSTTGLFSLDLSSTNGGANLTLFSGGGDAMEYFVVAYSYSENASRVFPDTRQEFTQPFTLNRRLGSPTPSCVGQGFGDANLYFAAAVEPANFNAAPAGIYRDTVVMTIRAE